MEKKQISVLARFGKFGVWIDFRPKSRRKPDKSESINTPTRFLIPMKVEKHISRMVAKTSGMTKEQILSSPELRKEMLLKFSKLAGCRIKGESVIFKSKKEMNGFFKRIAKLEDAFWQMRNELGVN